MLGRGGLGVIRHPLNGIRLVRAIARGGERSEPSVRLGGAQGSYRDAIDFGVISTPEMPDIWNLIEYLTQELDEFHAVD